MQPLMSLLPLILSRDRTPGDWMDPFILSNSVHFLEELFYGRQFPVCMACLNYVLVLVNFAAEVKVRHRRTFL